MESKHILIVEDEPTVLRLEKRILANAGYTVDAVLSGEKALEMLRDHGYAMVVTDVMMPGVDG